VPLANGKLQCTLVIHLRALLPDAYVLVQLSVYGGASRQTQVRAYRSGVEVLVATPGRLMDLVSSRVISLEHCTFFVLDEADRMLSMGFEAAIQDIIQQVPLLLRCCSIGS
jgi:superfamily II DNA/RNA helicase